MDDSTLLSIKDFSDFTGVHQSTLRYYDRIGLLTPIVRGDNNYRYYQPFQIIKLHYINVLIELGIPLAMIKDMSANRTPEKMVEMMSEQEVELDYQLYRLKTAYSIIHTYRSNIQRGLKAHEHDIRVEDLPEERMNLGQPNYFKDGDTFYNEFIRFCRSAEDYHINLRFPIGGYHSDMDRFRKLPGLPYRFFSLDPMGNVSRPKGKYLVGFIRGYYGKHFDKLPERMASYAEEHDLSFKGPVYSVYLLDEVSVIDPSQYLARVAVAVTE